MPKITIVSVSLLFSFFLLSSISIATTPQSKSRPHALLLPITKDQSTNQYLTQISQRTPLVPVKLTLDLGGQFLWVDCRNGYTSSTFKAVKCKSSQCKVDVKGPPCSVNLPGETSCPVINYNSISLWKIVGAFAGDALSIQSTDGANPGRLVKASKVFFGCGSRDIFMGLAGGVQGMLGLGRSYTGFPTQLALAFDILRTFALCLTSAGSNGVLFFGPGPYSFLPSQNIDISKSLLYTPLYVNSYYSDVTSMEGTPSVEYFIGVKAIKINGIEVAVNKTLLTINKHGYGGTKISTVDPYTVLQTSIYNAVTKAFVNALAKVPRAEPVAPFNVCYTLQSLGSTRTGVAVPPIELVLQGKVSWMMFGANSMVLVKDNIYCLGFVDGGIQPRTSIVIGGHQIEDNLLQFDLAKSRLGFSSSLLSRQTTCGNFNFTSNA